jgi:protein involved in polysaccharide export with SLBB domain
MTKLKSVISIIAVFLFEYINLANGQDKKERIGIDEIIKKDVNYYNYADKDKVNIEVGVWGYVKSPGKYLIPSGTTFVDLITLCGGPLAEAKMDDIRMVRMKNDSLNIKEDKIIILNYNDFLWEDRIQQISRQNPVLNPGDIILIPGTQKSFFKENFTLIMSAVTTMTSVAVLLVTIFKK